MKKRNFAIINFILILSVLVAHMYTISNWWTHVASKGNYFLEWRYYMYIILPFWYVEIVGVGEEGFLDFVTIILSIGLVINLWFILTNYKSEK